MAKKKIGNLELLLSKLDKKQLVDFIRKECANDAQLQDRFLALGAGTLFKPNSDTYKIRVARLIEKYGDSYGFIEYDRAYDFNRAVSRILDEADDAMSNNQWDIATAVLTGVTSMADDIINGGDDSDGELGGIVDDCFQKWHELCNHTLLPEKIKSEIFELALSKFIERDLKGWDWWWEWIEMAIELAHTPDMQNRVFNALATISKGQSDISDYNVKTAMNYKLKLMSKFDSHESQMKFMYDNVNNSDFRKRLLQIAWDDENYNEVLRLVKDGLIHDAEYRGLVSEWHKWEYKVYNKNGDVENTILLARYFFFRGGQWGDNEYSMGTMYSKQKSLVNPEDWGRHVENLISEANQKQDTGRLLYIYTQEKMWDNYMNYLRKNPSTYNIDDAPKEVKKLYKDEIIKLYTSAVKAFFQRAANRDSYREGVGLLRNLIKYGGKSEADKIVIEQRSRTPRRPALIDELSKL